MEVPKLLDIVGEAFYVLLTRNQKKQEECKRTPGKLLCFEGIEFLVCLNNESNSSKNYSLTPGKIYRKIGEYYTDESGNMVITDDDEGLRRKYPARIIQKA